MRKTKTASGSTAVQVVYREKGKTIILRHIGSGLADEDVGMLVERAIAWIAQRPEALPLFPPQERRTLSLATAQFTGATHRFAYDTVTVTGDRFVLRMDVPDDVKLLIRQISKTPRGLSTENTA